ncbi:MAG: PaaI family thioesterase [Pseudomonadota bacterium]
MSVSDLTPEEWTARSADCFPGKIGMRVVSVEPEEIVASFAISPDLFAPNGFLHAGALVTLADTCCGIGAVRNLPEGANGFTTIDLTSNMVGTAREGAAICSAKPLHLGRTTQVWEATVTSEATGKPMTHFRCTQMILWPR